MDNKLQKQYQRDFGHWHVKMDFLTKEIENLKKQSSPISLVSAFLLETQYIEFHLQGLILELELIKDTEPKLVNFTGKKSKKVVYEMTLGELKNEIEKYKADFLLELKTNLLALNKIRVQFSHHIFSYSTSIDDLLVNAKKGIKANNEVLVSLSKAFKYSEENSWFGKMMASKRVPKKEK